MIINGYFKLARDGSVFKGALDISDKDMLLLDNKAVVTKGVRI